MQLTWTENIISSIIVIKENFFKKRTLLKIQVFIRTNGARHNNIKDKV